VLLGELLLVLLEFPVVALLSVALAPLLSAETSDMFIATTSS
jgi:hypothetical protein